ncbi:MAG: hypothetical protein JO149_04485, partial [Gammaproteobacteria bacterium]|nr:hypothetical protein [Gammaproteobacteria bacterium]
VSEIVFWLGEFVVFAGGLTALANPHLRERIRLWANGSPYSHYHQDQDPRNWIAKIIDSIFEAWRGFAMGRALIVSLETLLPKLPFPASVRWGFGGAIGLLQGGSARYTPPAAPDFFQAPADWRKIFTHISLVIQLTLVLTFTAVLFSNISDKMPHTVLQPILFALPLIVNLLHCLLAYCTQSHETTITPLLEEQTLRPQTPINNTVTEPTPLLSKFNNTFFSIETYTEQKSVVSDTKQNTFTPSIIKN